ncbi:MAG: linear amide C-N hydrolase [Lachnospiraceae bacterium]|nr:linear amide C-N hydrolase [Lachnospiraceae bacterium]
MKKALRIISYVVPMLVVLAVACVGIMYFNEIRTLLSMSLVEGTNLYTMEYFSDYSFDEFLQRGADNNNDYYSYINNLFGNKINIGPASSYNNDACSAFTAKGSDGSRYHARNYDNTPNPVMLVVTSPNDAFRSVSAVNLNCIGYNNESKPKRYDLKPLAAPYFPTDGMNEKGISISMLQVNFSRKQKEDGVSCINAYSVIRLVLDYADSIDSAVSLIDNYNIYFDTSMMVHFLVCDKDGNSALIEFIDGEMHVIENDKSYQIASNFNNEEEVFDEDGYVYFDEYKSWLINASTSAYDSEYSCYIRYDLMADILYNNSGIMDIDDAFSLLEDVASSKKLQYSVIYNLSSLEATIITDNDWEKRTTVALVR